MTRRDEIIETALTLSEEVGVERLSMRMIGDRMGTSAMAIYRHLPNRDALLDAMVGRVLAGVRLPGPRSDWRRRLRVIGQGLFDAATAHPAVFRMVLSRSYVAGEAVAVMRAMYEVLTDAGVPPAQVPRVERMISTSLIGYAVAASGRAFWPEDPVRFGGGWRWPDQPDAVAQPAPAHWRRELGRNIDDLVRMVEDLGRRTR